MYMKKSYDDIQIDDTVYNDEYSNDKVDNTQNYSKVNQNTITRGITQVQHALFNTPSESHNLIVYSDIRVLRAMYPAYVKSLLEDNEIVLIMTYYDHPSMVRQFLDLDSKKSDHVDIEGYLNNGSLVIVDSLMTYFNSLENNQININNNDNDNYADKTNFLSLIRMLLNHGVKNNKKGITIFSDMGSFFHFGNSSHHQYHDNNNNDNIHNIMEYERSIPTRYKDLELKKFCLYHQKDYEMHFKSKRQKAQLLDCHGKSILIMDVNSNYDYNRSN